MKKLLAFFLFAMLLCSLIPFAATSVFAADEPTIQVCIEETELEAGDTFEVTVNLLNIPDPGLIGALVKLGWDEDVMELVTYYDEDEEDYFPMIEVGTKYNASSNKYITFGPLGTCNVTYLRSTASSSQVRKEEHFFTATFKIKDDAVSGNYAITVKDYNPKNMISYGNVATDFVIEDATITIGSSEPEHVCADENKDHVCDNGCGEPQGEHKSNAPACVAGVCEYCKKSVAASASHNWQNASYVWGDDNSACVATRVCGNGCSTKEQATAVVTSNTTSGTCKVAATTVYTATFTSDWAVNQTKTVTGQKNPDNHEQTPTYTNNGANHSVAYSCCDTTATEKHTYDKTTHKCVCGDVETFTLTVTDVNGVILETKAVPYGAVILEYVTKTPAPFYENSDYCIQVAKFDGEWGYDGFVISDSDKMPAKDVVLVPNMDYTGWEREDEDSEWYYIVDGKVQFGWMRINHADYMENGTGSDWYYLDPVTGFRAEGLTRVPYPTKAINGVTYAPNAEDLAYYEAHKSSSAYSDADSAEFYFGADGKFQATFTGIVGDSYVVGGIAPWHVGFVEVDGEYYYFAGDKVNGGNVMATGKVYTSRANKTGKVDGVYNFDTDGTLIGNYYGLYEYKGGIYYRRTSTGELATGWYYITVTNGIEGFKEGDKLFFGEDGKMGLLKNGIVKEEDGKLYYYDNNTIKGAGLIKIGDDYYYVRTSTGEVVTGEYCITVTNGIEGFYAGQKCVFDENGKFVK